MGAKRGTERENQLLVAAGFESTDEEEDLWNKEGVWYGRNAALQSARLCKVRGVRCARPPAQTFWMRKLFELTRECLA